MLKVVQQKTHSNLFAITSRWVFHCDVWAKRVFEKKETNHILKLIFGSSNDFSWSAKPIRESRREMCGHKMRYEYYSRLWMRTHTFIVSWWRCATSGIAWFINWWMRNQTNAQLFYIGRIEKFLLEYSWPFMRPFCNVSLHSFSSVAASQFTSSWREIQPAKERRRKWSSRETKISEKPQQTKCNLNITSF